MKPINIAILGAGAIATHMADAVRRCPDIVCPYAVASRNLGKADSLAREFGFRHSYGSYEALLMDRSVDVVYIAVPHALHSQMALMCLEAGKHVLVEKPFAANEAQARAVIDLARKKSLLAAEGLWMRYLPVVHDIQNACRSGMIGNIKMVSGEIGYHLTQNRLFDPHMAGGALLDVGVYALALAGMVLGYDVKELHSTAAFIDGLNGAGPVDECNSFILKYPTGQMAAMNLSMTYMSSGHGTIWGDAGYIDIHDINQLDTIRVYDRSKREIACYHGAVVENSYVFELKALATALAEGRLDTPECPHQDILSRIQLMDRLRQQWGLVFPFESEVPPLNKKAISTGGPCHEAL